MRAGVIVWAVFGLACVALLTLLLTGVIKVPGITFLQPAVLIKSESFPLASQKSIELDAPPYFVEVRVVDSTDITVRQYGVADTDAGSYFTASNEDGRLSVDAGRSPQNWFMNFDFSEKRIEIDIPASYGGALTVNTASGEIEVGSTASLASLDLHSSSGAISTDNVIAANVSLSSSSGEVNCGDISAGQSGGDIPRGLKISTSSGAVKAEDITGFDSAVVETSSGAIKLDEVSADAASVSAHSGAVSIGEFRSSGEVKTSSGAVLISEMELTGDMSISSNSGAVNVGLDKKSRVSVSASSGSGSVRSDFGLTSGDSNRASGTIGEAPYFGLTISTGSGAIYIGRTD